MMKTRVAVVPALLCALAVLWGCLPESQKPVALVAVVDVERVLREAKSSRAGREHLAAVQAVLQKGWDELQTVSGNEPQEQRQRALAQGLQTLQTRIAEEEAAASAVVLEQMRSAIRNWRLKNKGSVVMARQNLLDASSSVDITTDIITAMDAKEQPKFPALPEVTVQPPKAGRDAPPPPPQPAASGRKTPAAPRGR
ncbi:MAG: OmpH family outer membrane protein [Desulfovibrio sp.]|nr:OmpH family outer membrane protein [Desulfovibrio sp.]